MKTFIITILVIFAASTRAQIVPGSSGHGAPGFSCAANDTYKDVDNGLVWLCGPGNNNWKPTPQYVPWVSPAVGNCPVGNGTTFVSSPCGGSGGIQSITSLASTLALGGDISNTTIDIDLTHANTWVPLQSFTGGVKIGTGANAYIQQAPGSGIYQITNNANTIGVGILPVGTTLGYSINGVSPTFSSAYFNLIIGAGSPIATGGSKIETNPANFLSSDNTAEYQLLTQIGSASILSEIAQGNITTVIKNTNIKLQGAVTFNGVAPVISFNSRTGAVSPASADYTAAQVTNALDLSQTATQTMQGNLLMASGKSINTPIIRDSGGTAVATLSGSSLLGSGIVDGKAPVTVSTTTPVTLGGTFKSGYTYNAQATAAAAQTYNLPSVAAGLQYCVGNSWNGSAATTGIITVVAASGQIIIFTDGTLSATSGNVTSGGAAADAACFIGVDGGHWQLTVVRGAWTKH